MNQATRLTMEQRNGNLHITVDGGFTPATALQLVLGMNRHYQGNGNIFIHTKLISEIVAESRTVFNRLLPQSSLPRERIYFIGARGMELATDSGKVIIPPKRNSRCGGCAGCAAKRGRPACP